MDYLRLVGAVSNLDDVIDLMGGDHGRNEARGGRHTRFRRGVRFESGAEIYYTPELDTSGMCVELNGVVCSATEPGSLLSLLHWLLGRSFHCTRFDGRVDWRGCKPIRLVEMLKASCEAGEICGARHWEPHPKYRCRELVGDGLSIGKRGKDGSGRYVRVYDKGLETGRAPVGEWERFEVEFLKGCANQVACAVGLAFAAGGDWRAELYGLVMASIDVRENNGSRRIDRRPRVGWWAELVDGYERRRVCETREPSRLENHVEWLRRCALSSARQMAARTGESVEAVLRRLVGRLEPRDDGRCRAVVKEYCDFQGAG